MTIKKSEIYAKIWQGCDELRGGMDASQYKDYILVLLFLKYISDKYARQKKPLLIIPEGCTFDDMVKLKGQSDTSKGKGGIGDGINKIIGKIADANENLKFLVGLTDFNDPHKLGEGKEMVDRLSNLVATFEDLHFDPHQIGGDDLLGDAYEYLMRNFATQSGKSKGQFYTPAEVSHVIAKIVGVGQATSGGQTIYDPTCGSGSLLLKAHHEAMSMTGFDLAVYGQEMDNATYSLALMNMVLHDCPTAEIVQGNTLSNPKLVEKDGRLKTFDFVVVNPPFSSKAWMSGLTKDSKTKAFHDPFGRFTLGVPPEKNGDYAFLLHVLASLKSTGKAAIILPHGVLFRGNIEAEIREKIVRQGWIKGIIGLPANLFYGTSIPACILVIDKENAMSRPGIFMMDASQGFMKDGNKNRLRARDIHQIVDTFTREIEIPGYSKMVPYREIEANEFNLNLPRYIASTTVEDIQDIQAHLLGGIPDRDLDALQPYWRVFPGMRELLFAPLRPGYSQLKIARESLQASIEKYLADCKFGQKITPLLSQWIEKNKSHLQEITKHTIPKQWNHQLSESLLQIFSSVESTIFDVYEIYQHWMDFWETTLQDDVDTIMRSGWQAVISDPPDGKAKPKQAKNLQLWSSDRGNMLSPTEVKKRVIEEKWLPQLDHAIQAQITQIAQTLTHRIQELAQRYEKPLVMLQQEAQALEQKIEQHFKDMGIK